MSTSGHPDKAHLATAEGEFKKRYYNHVSSFKNKTQMNKSTFGMYHLITVLQKVACYAEKFEITQKFSSSDLLKPRISDKILWEF